MYGGGAKVNLSGVVVDVDGDDVNVTVCGVVGDGDSVDSADVGVFVDGGCAASNVVEGNSDVGSNSGDNQKELVPFPLSCDKYKLNF